MRRLDTIQDLRHAADRLCEAEPRFAGITTSHGLPALRHAEPGLESLLRIVTDQLISLRAGEAIWSRLAQRIGRLTPGSVLAVPLEELRRLGLTGAKARTFHAAAAAFATGPLATSDVLSEEEWTRRLTEIPGVGPWTASIYLLMVLRSPDAWPAADLALQRAAQDLFSLPARPSASQMALMAEPWRPHRTTAALLLWQHYRHLRGSGTV